jgi:hypothetical protein
MNDRLQSCFDELWAVCPNGQAETVTTAGGYVNKPGSHGRGEAIDIDAAWWIMDDFDRPQPLITKNHEGDIMRYLGTDAVLRMHFGGVLGYYSNRAHADHWHIDARPVGFTRYKNSSCLGFVQAACKHVHKVDPGPIDKRWGPRTRAAIQVVMAGDWAVSADLREPLCWREFLRLTFLKGWECAENPWG